MRPVLVCIAFATIAFSGIQARAGAPAFIPIQGVLSDSGGNAIAGTVAVTFSIYYAALGGAPLWKETQEVTLSDGVFAVYLGFVEPLDAEFVKENNSLWLAIRVEDDSEMQRVFLGSAPFALYAEQCGTVPMHQHDVADVTSAVKAGQSCQQDQAIYGFDENGSAICVNLSPGGPVGSGYALSGQFCPPSQAMAGVDNEGYPVCVPVSQGGTYSGQDFALSNQDCSGDQVVTGISSYGQLECASGAGGGIGGSGVSKRLAMFKSSDELDDSIVTQSSSKIGINDTSPSRTLDVNGDLQVSKDFYWGGNKFSSSSCVVIGGTSCSSACSSHGMSCYKAFRIDGESTSTSCSQSGFKFCCCKD
jgi:hypothetical protein